MNEEEFMDQKVRRKSGYYQRWAKQKNRGD